jgi:hypothetical protein
MDLTLDEQRLIAEYRRLTTAGRDDLLAYASTLVRQASGEKENDTATNQCPLKSAEPHPEAEKTPVFTE